MTSIASSIVTLPFNHAYSEILYSLNGTIIQGYLYNLFNAYANGLFNMEKMYFDSITDKIMIWDFS